MYAVESGRIVVESASIIPANPKLTSANEAQHFRKDLIFLLPKAVSTIIANKKIFIKMFIDNEMLFMKITREKIPPIIDEINNLIVLKLYPVIAALARKSR